MKKAKPSDGGVRWNGICPDCAAEHELRARTIDIHWCRSFITVCMNCAAPNVRMVGAVIKK